MSKRILKKICVLVTTVLMMNSMINPVMADDIFYNIQSSSEDFASDTSYSKLRGNHLNLGNVEITKLSSNEISIYGLTQCHHDCYHVDLDIALEWKVDGSYCTYKSWEFDASNTSSLAKSMVVIVPSGHYYRLRGYHAAKDGGVKESTTTLTSGILVK